MPHGVPRGLTVPAYSGEYWGKDGANGPVSLRMQKNPSTENLGLSLRQSVFLTHYNRVERECTFLDVCAVHISVSDYINM